MVNQPDPNTEKSEMRVMWIGSLAIVLVLLGAMGINMLMAHNTSTGTVETTGQSGRIAEIAAKTGGVKCSITK
jgi:hypothetical protein